MANQTTERPDTAQHGALREAVGVFRDLEALQCAVDDLQSCGINRANISTVASQQTVREELGHEYRDVKEIEDDFRVPRTHFISRISLGDAEGMLIGIMVYVFAIIAAGVAANAGFTVLGITVAVIIVGGIGGAIGWAAARWLDQRYSHEIQEQLRHGGIVLWVTVHDAEQEKCAVTVLNKYKARDVHVHEEPVRQAA